MEVEELSEDEGDDNEEITEAFDMFKQGDLAEKLAETMASIEEDTAVYYSLRQSTLRDCTTGGGRRHSTAICYRLQQEAVYDCIQIDSYSTPDTWH